MVTLSIRLPNGLLKKIDALAKELNISRSGYIRKAIESMNNAVTTGKQRRRLMTASKKVRGESMKVNAEFAVFEEDDCH